MEESWEGVRNLKLEQTMTKSPLHQVTVIEKPAVQEARKTGFARILVLVFIGLWRGQKLRSVL